MITMHTNKSQGLGIGRCRAHEATPKTALAPSSRAASPCMATVSDVLSASTPAVAAPTNSPTSPTVLNSAIACAPPACESASALPTAKYARAHLRARAVRGCVGDERGGRRP